MSPLASQAKTQKIGDCDYRVEPLGFLDGRKAFVRLVNLIGPALSKFESGKMEETGAAAIGQLLTSIKDEDLQYFQELFQGRTIVVLPEGREPVLKDILKDHFQGDRFGDYFLWLGHCLWVCFGPFFKGLLKNAGSLGLSQKASASISPTESNGKTGD